MNSGFLKSQATSESVHNVHTQSSLARKQSIDLAISVQYGSTGINYVVHIRFCTQIKKERRCISVHGPGGHYLIYDMLWDRRGAELSSVVLTLRGFLAAGKELSTVQSVNSEEPSFTWLSCCC